MDLSKIFLKDACPTKMGGQAVMEGIMMKGEKKTALAVRLPRPFRPRFMANGRRSLFCAEWWHSLILW